MSGNRKFHNKFHSANHHTLPSPHIKDSGLDPIASYEFPFIGDFVLNGTVSASNNYLLNNGNKRATTLDTIRHGLPVPPGWNVFRDSTYIDGDVTISGNLSAYGEMTYLHTQVHSTSATEIEILADNSNGKNVALLIDQYGTNDIVHIKNDGSSTLIITGSAAESELRGGNIGVNLGNLPDVDRPNQRMTIVGSVSVVPDPYETSDQTQQADPGTTGSIYIEGGLHVNDKTYLDQVTIDTTDGKFVVSGGDNDGTSNIMDVLVPSEFDKVTIDTTDGRMVVSGSNQIYINTDPGIEIDTHTQLDQLTVDTTDGQMYVTGTNKVSIDSTQGLDVDTHTQLDQLTVNTSDGDMHVYGTNKIYVNTEKGVDIDTHATLDQVTVDTTDGVFLVSGSGLPGQENPVDVDVPINLDRVTVDTTDGTFYISGSGVPGQENSVDVDVPINLDRVTIDTTDGTFHVSGTGIAGQENPVDIDVPVNLDRVTIDTTDGATVIQGSGLPADRNPLDVRVPHY